MEHDVVYLVGFAPMDGTFASATDVAHRPLRTATRSHENSSGGPLGLGDGAVLHDAEGETIGAIGNSNGWVEDEIVAQAAAAAVTD
jgi:hypothetical protein